MNNKVINYKIVVIKDQRTGTDEVCYTAYVPEFGISTDGDTIDEVIQNIKKLTKFHVESLIEEGDSTIIIHESTDSFVFDANIEMNIPVNAKTLTN